MKPGTKAEWVAGRIERQIRRDRLPDRTRLPPIKTLAERYGVSYGTMQAALKALAARGVVDLVDGSGVYVRAAADQAEQAAREKAALQWQSRSDEIADDLVRGILEGHYRLGEYLPAQKELRFRYHTSNATLKAALEQVRQRRLIHRRGRGFVVGRGALARPKRERDRVYVVGLAAQFRLIGHHRISRDFIRSFENELDRCGVPGIQVLDTVSDPSALAQAVSRKDTLGFLHLGVGMGGVPQDAGERLQRELNLLAGSGLPMVLFTYNDLVSRFPDVRFKAGRNVWLHWTDNLGAGEAIGTYLAALGHRDVAWLNYYAQSVWGRQRFEGFQTATQTALGEDARIRRFGPDDSHRFSRSQDIHRTLEEMLGILRRKHRLSASAPTERFIDATRRLVGDDASAEAMERFFEEALADKAVTAWACSSELMAVMAAAFLRRKGVRVPEDISLIAINNDEDAFVTRITAYDFLKRHLGYLAAHCLLGDIPIRTRRGRFLLCPGQIVERGSVQAR